MALQFTMLGACSGLVLHIPLQQPLQTASLTPAGEEAAGALWWAWHSPVLPSLGTGAVSSFKKWAEPSRGQETLHRHTRGCSPSGDPSGYPSGDVSVSHNSSMLHSGEGQILP